MKVNILKSFENLDDAWLYWYNELLSQDSSQSSRDGGIKGEIINAVTILENPTNNIMKNDIRKLSIKYAIGELLWYLSGNRKLQEIQKYSKGWDRMTDDGVNVNSNYGYCIMEKFGFNQWQWVKNELKTNQNSRRAIIHIKEPSDKPSKDVNCTVSLQFFIRENKLFLTTYMRSNDIWFGFPYDVFQFTNMQILMSMELGLNLGSYTHFAGSLHLYERDVVKGNDARKLKYGF